MIRRTYFMYAETVEGDNGLKVKALHHKTLNVYSLFEKNPVDIMIEMKDSIIAGNVGTTVNNLNVIRFNRV
jgi:hypothetical protein